ncbi:hypothetical protein C8J57DRAFT_1511256 [Mycena rebaudengoi]|nr:hypothetical protein C8J57DRAFT_1511256 [Mycena rebaudengoi]
MRILCQLPDIIVLHGSSHSPTSPPLPRSFSFQSSSHDIPLPSLHAHKSSIVLAYIIPCGVHLIPQEPHNPVRRIPPTPLPGPADCGSPSADIGCPSMPAFSMPLPWSPAPSAFHAPILAHSSDVAPTPNARYALCMLHVKRRAPQNAAKAPHILRGRCPGFWTDVGETYIVASIAQNDA